MCEPLFGIWDMGEWEVLGDNIYHLAIFTCSSASPSIKTRAQMLVACKPCPVMIPASPKSGYFISRFREAGFVLLFHGWKELFFINRMDDSWELKKHKFHSSCWLSLLSFVPLSVTGALFSWYLQIALTESYLSKGERHNWRYKNWNKKRIRK